MGKSKKKSSLAESSTKIEATRAVHGNSAPASHSVRPVVVQAISLTDSKAADHVTQLVDDPLLQAVLLKQVEAHQSGAGSVSVGATELALYKKLEQYSQRLLEEAQTKDQTILDLQESIAQLKIENLALRVPGRAQSDDSDAVWEITQVFQSNEYLKAKLGELQGQLDKALARNADLEAAMANHESSWGNITAAVAQQATANHAKALAEQKAEYDQKLAKLAKRGEELTTRLSQLQQGINNAPSTENKAFSLEREAYEAEIADLKKQLKKAGGASRSASSAAGAATPVSAPAAEPAETQALRDQLTAVRAELKAEQAKHQKLSEASRPLTKKVEKLERQLEGLRAEMKGKDRIARMHGDHQEAPSRVEVQQREKVQHELEQQLARVGAELSEAQAKSDALAAGREQTQAENSGLKAELSELRAQFAVASEALAQMRTRLAEAEQQLIEVTAEKRELSERVTKSASLSSVAPSAPFSPKGACWVNESEWRDLNWAMAELSRQLVAMQAELEVSRLNRQMLTVAPFFTSGPTLQSTTQAATASIDSALFKSVQFSN